MSWNNNWFIKEHVLEHRTSGVVTSLTIKLAAYAKDTMTKVTGDGSNFISHDDCTWKTHTKSGNQYYAYDNYTELATRSYSYTVPVDQQTDIVQAAHGVSFDTDARTYKTKRKAWKESYKNSADALAAYTSLLDDLGQ
jgi:hypothetical protein